MSHRPRRQNFLLNFFGQNVDFTQYLVYGSENLGKGLIISPNCGKIYFGLE